jgi:hypothetical protein
MGSKLALFAAALLAAAAPSVTPGAVTINLKPQGLTPDASNRLLLVPGASDYTVRIEVFGTDADGSDERLNAYTIAITGSGLGNPFGDATGVRFGVPGSTFGAAGRPVEHPFVFKDLETTPPIENFSSTPSKLQFASTAVGQDDEVNIDPAHSGFIAAPLIIPADAPPGVYTISVTTTSLAGLGAPIVSTAGVPLTIMTILPEPSTVGLLLVPPLALLLRRRGARAAGNSAGC